MKITAIQIHVCEADVERVLSQAEEEPLPHRSIRVRNKGFIKLFFHSHWAQFHPL